ncbi:hypothetical protein [Streptomyces sp. WM6378]|uniref:hypothetical protein n=1 Tax=Streptomyces sp. WM6378 TaxID=1415557 RepID=UPI00131B03AF|nr:hypothetical protein [Streptomyces sp. WM6378]
MTTTAATIRDVSTLPATHAHLEERNLLPAEHLVDGGYTSVAMRDSTARDYQIDLVGPVKEKTTRKSRKGNVFDRDAFTIDWDRQEVVCPQGTVTRQWSTPPSITPYTRVFFNKVDCIPCPVRTDCTRSQQRPPTLSCGLWP